MFGAIIGDIVGSRYEFHNHLSKDFDLFATSCTYTDDTVMTCAVADLFLQHNPETVTQKEAIEMLREYGKIYPGAGYGNRYCPGSSRQSPMTTRKASKAQSVQPSASSSPALG